MLIILSFLCIFWVMRVNSYAASNVRVEKDQKVIDTGPYAYVRHPMYAGALLMLIGTPVALGSWWGLLTLLPMFAAIVMRLLDEEEFLTANLTGYADYRARVRYRLVPYVW